MNATMKSIPTVFFSLVAQVTAAALMGCQSRPLIDMTMSAADASDKTLAVSGCEGSLGRGFTSCRFIDGAPYGTLSIDVVLPKSSSVTTSMVRVRSGANVFSTTSSGNTVSIKYTDLFDGGVFNSKNDGPIQVVVSTKMVDGSIIQTLGYVYLVILKKGYNPLPWERITTCSVSYDSLGRSTVTCE